MKTVKDLKAFIANLPDSTVLGFDDEYDLASVKYIYSFKKSYGVTDNSFEFVAGVRRKDKDFDCLIFSREGEE